MYLYTHSCAVYTSYGHYSVFSSLKASNCATAIWRQWLFEGDYSKQYLVEEIRYVTLGVDVEMYSVFTYLQTVCLVAQQRFLLV